MKQAIFLILLTAITKSSFGQFKTNDVQYDKDLCIKIEKRYDGACSNKTDIVVKITNKCSETLDGMIAIEKEDGSWSKGYFNNLKPGASQDGFWTCKSSGQVRIYRAKAGKAHLEDYPTEKQLRESFGTKKYGYNSNY